jgi:hypothetical protein
MESKLYTFLEEKKRGINQIIDFMEIKNSETINRILIDYSKLRNPSDHQIVEIVYNAMYREFEQEVLTDIADEIEECVKKYLLESGYKFNYEYLKLMIPNDSLNSRMRSVIISRVQKAVKESISLMKD